MTYQPNDTTTVTLQSLYENKINTLSLIKVWHCAWHTEGDARRTASEIDTEQEGESSERKQGLRTERGEAPLPKLWE